MVEEWREWENWNKKTWPIGGPVIDTRNTKDVEQVSFVLFTIFQFNATTPTHWKYVGTKNCLENFDKHFNYNWQSDIVQKKTKVAISSFAYEDDMASIIIWACFNSVENTGYYNSLKYVEMHRSNTIAQFYWEMHPLNTIV